MLSLKLGSKRRRIRFKPLIFFLIVVVVVVVVLGLCLEKRVFYRALSGLHSSINIHLCAMYLFRGKDKNPVVVVALRQCSFS